ncbi:hypothetical protein PRZ48_003728 [Zasmidium cellare]|uniref:Uncharacterized protein n=1 Tax=Zasmidium cellare TaxID=395010 RepID=A0ABR0EY25_ZASCE|nr:hypothetical protein PRZ48_003728 [Zasmidium cellare]
MGSEAPAVPELDNTILFHQLDSYPWDEDQEFQGGLRAILGSVSDPEQVSHLTLRAKCYYYARKAGTNVDFDGYKQWVEQQRGNGQTNETEVQANNTNDEAPAQTNSNSSGAIGGDAPKPASFAEIVELIAEGKPIPGIKEIPDTILEGQASENQAEKRKKPWEKESGATESPSWMT